MFAGGSEFLPMRLGIDRDGETGLHAARWSGRDLAGRRCRTIGRSACLRRRSGSFLHRRARALATALTFVDPEESHPLIHG
jgi:hypothetical protein